LFDEFYFDELRLLKGQEGAKKLLLKYPDASTIIPFPLGSIDIDTTDDFEKLNSQ
jgi:molybdenum cofactor cytidylyltransferase